MNETGSGFRIWRSEEREEFFVVHGEARMAATKTQTFASVLPSPTYTDGLVELRANGDPERIRQEKQHRDEYLNRLQQKQASFQLLIPAEVLASYSAGSYVMHTVNSAISLAVRRQHLKHIADLMKKGAFELRLYPKEESLYFTVCDCSSVHVVLGPHAADALWGFSSWDPAVVCRFGKAFEGMWVSSKDSDVQDKLVWLSELVK